MMEGHDENDDNMMEEQVTNQIELNREQRTGRVGEVGGGAQRSRGK